jgi:hypothetical protein
MSLRFFNPLHKDMTTNRTVAAGPAASGERSAMGDKTFPASSAQLRTDRERHTLNVFSRWTRSATAVAAAVASLAAVAAIPATASALSVGTANKTSHTSPVIKSVTYARFRTLLQQSGHFAFLIGDPAENSAFATQAQNVEAAAEAAGLTKVYWFDPKLSGDAKAGGSAWRNLVDQDLKSLGNAVPATAGNVERAKITGSNSYFFLSYHPSGIVPTASTKVISWIDLSKEASLAATRADVTTAIKNDGSLAPVDALVIRPRDDSGSGCSSAITNPALHPYKVQVTIDGQVYNDGCDTLPGEDDIACTPIPDVQYDFADNEIFYYDGQGNLLATAPWTEWQRISSYTTWEAQQQAAASGSGSGSSGSGSSGSGSSGSGSSGSGSSGSGSSGSGSSGSGSSGSGSTSTPADLSRSKVKKIAGAVSKAPSSKSAGKYKVTITAGSGKATATGKLTLHVYKVGSHTATATGTLSKGTVTFSIPKLAKGTWNVLISWPGNTHYQAASVAGSSIKVTK